MIVTKMVTSVTMARALIKTKVKAPVCKQLKYD